MVLKLLIIRPTWKVLYWSGQMWGVLHWLKCKSSELLDSGSVTIHLGRAEKLKLFSPKKEKKIKGKRELLLWVTVLFLDFWVNAFYHSKYYFLHSLFSPQDMEEVMGCMVMSILLIMQLMIWYYHLINMWQWSTKYIYSVWVLLLTVLVYAESILGKDIVRESWLAMLLLWSLNWWCYRFEGRYDTFRIIISVSIQILLF